MLDGNAGNANTDFSRARISPTLTQSSQSPHRCPFPIPSDQSPPCPPPHQQGTPSWPPGCGSRAGTHLSSAGIPGACRGTSIQFIGHPGGWLGCRQAYVWGRGSKIRHTRDGGKLGYICRHPGNWLSRCHLLQEMTHHTCIYTGPIALSYSTTGLFLWSFPQESNVVTGIKEIEDKAKTNICTVLFFSVKKLMHDRHHI